MENDYKYTLIISQYYHDYHYFVVEFDENTFVKNMQDLTIELDLYKSGNVETDRDIKKSDPFYSDSSKIKYRYNVNAHGDIYFINSRSANAIQRLIQKDISDNRSMNYGFKKKAILEDINKNHNYSKVAEIITKHFKIA